MSAEQSSPCYTVQFAPPELLRLYGQKQSQASAGAPHDMWALGAIFEQLLAATCQMGPLFLPDPTRAAKLQKLSERELVLHELVAAEQDAWVRFLILTWHEVCFGPALTFHANEITMLMPAHKRLQLLSFTVTVQKMVVKDLMQSTEFVSVLLTGWALWLQAVVKALYVAACHCLLRPILPINTKLRILGSAMHKGLMTVVKRSSGWQGSNCMCVYAGNGACRSQQGQLGTTECSYPVAESAPSSQLFRCC